MRFVVIFRHLKAVLKTKPVTLLAILLCTIVFGTKLLGDYRPYIFLMYSKTAILQYHQWYRIFTVSFVHANFLHFIFNMYALWYTGSILEQIYKPIKFLVLLTCSILFGSLVLLLFPVENAVGMSGGIYGLFGCVLTSLLTTYGLRNSALNRSLFQVIVLNVIISFGNVAYQAHIGGLIFGVMFYYMNQNENQSLRLNALLATIIFTGIIILKLFGYL